MNFSNLVQNLTLPESVLSSISKERTNEELRVYAQTLPQLLYPDTYILAGRLLMNLNIKSCPNSIEDYVDILKDILHKDIAQFMLRFKTELDELLESTYERNFEYDIMSTSACLNYLLKLDPENPPVETPCHLYLRQAVQFYHKDSIKAVKKCYYEFLDKQYVHATPTMMNGGTRKNQMSSCFLLTIGDDLESLLYTGVGDVGMISKAQGGIGLSLSSVRHSSIANTGASSGVMPFGHIYDATIKCVDQGGKRNGAMTITLIDWHIDFLDFIQARDNTTHNGIRFKQANICAYISSEFMRRVRENKKWTLFCPSRAVIEVDGKEVRLTGLHSGQFDDHYHLFEEEAERREQEYEKFCKKLKEMESFINSGESGKETMKLYQKRLLEKNTLKKKLIVRKTVNAIDVYEKLCDMHIKSSMPYIVYRDTVNYKNNMKNIGTVEGLNLCVAPETLVLTDRGHKEIKSIENQSVNVWNGKEFSEVIIKQTGENQELIKVVLSDGSRLECTPYHKFYIQTKYPSSKLKSDIITSSNVEKIEAKNLESGMKLVKCSFPIIDYGDDLENAYTNGFFSGDGTYLKRKESHKACGYMSQKNKKYCKRHSCYELEDDAPSETCEAICYTDKPSVTLYHEKIKLLEHLSYRSIGEIVDNKLNVQLNVNIKEKFYVPTDKSLKSKLEWFSGYIDADGCVVENEENQSVQVSSINEQFLINVKYMLQTCGCNPKISVASEERKTMLPDGNGGQKEYQCQKLYRLLITSFDLQTLLNNGLKTYRLDITKRDIQRSAGHFVTVKEVINTGRVSDTYCFTEHKRNAGIFNGVFTSQCLEITEPSTPDSIASCNLAHVNLKRFVKGHYIAGTHIKDSYDFQGLGEATRSLVRNLNKVIDYNRYPLDQYDNDGRVIQHGKISKPNFENRPLGIGVSGLAEVFANLNIYYDSDEAYEVNKMIFACMYYNGLLESNIISKEEHISSFQKDKQNNVGYKNFRYGSFKAFVDNQWKEFRGSPLSNGMFQFDMWKQEADYLSSLGNLNEKIYNREDDIPIEPNEWGQAGSWDILRRSILSTGVYNSMILAPMPTASSAQLLRNAETTEAHQTLVYSRKVAHGNYTAFSEPFIEDMRKYNLWNQKTVDFIMLENGSIKNFKKLMLEFQSDFPSEYYNDKQLTEEFNLTMDHLIKKHRGMYEISQKVCLKMARQRGIYIDQSQSLNIYLAEPDMRKLKAIHDYSESLRLKTGMYYLRANPSSQTDRFTVNIDMQEFHNNIKNTNKVKKQVVCTEDVCTMCQ